MQYINRRLGDKAEELEGCHMYRDAHLLPKHNQTSSQNMSSRASYNTVLCDFSKGGMNHKESN